MMNKIKIFRNISIVIIPLLMVFSSCFFGTTVKKTVTPTIRTVGLPEASIIDSVTLKVTGSDMDPVEVSYQVVPSVINLAIPEGNDRTFELTVGTGPAYTGTIATFSGTATADINNDGAVITLNMRVGSTKLIVPDYQNDRVIQFDDINDNESLSLTLIILNFQLLINGFGPLPNFVPYDIDFDSQGRIYIANYDGSTGSGIIRVDNILGTNAIRFGSSHGGIVSLTVDRENNVIYYSNGSNIYKSDLDGNDESTLNSTGISNIRGMAVTDSGILYIAGNTPAGDPTVFQYNPVTQNVTGTYDTNLVTPWDVMVKGDKLYIANLGGADDYQILELSTSDLSFIASYGSTFLTIPDVSNGRFYGPRRFVAQLNDEITIIDDLANNDFDKIIQIDNMNGDNWITLPESGSGQILFKFFNVSV